MSTRMHPRSRSGRARVDALERRTLFAFGLTHAAGGYTVDTGAHTVFTVADTNGDLTSVKYSGTELTAPSSATARYSHYESGLSSTSTTVTATLNAAAGWVLISCADPSLGVTQYYVARSGYDNIYMATYAAALPTPGEMRFITYLNRSVFTNIPDPSNISQTNGTVEGSDVFYNTTSGQTYSKFYGANPAIDDAVHGVTGANVGAFMNTGSAWETASGGPFFKDIEFQTTTAATEMYEYMNSGHEQTEAYRPGLHGPYALQFTNGGAPVAPDYAFIAGLGLTGYVAPAARGAVAGRAGTVLAGTRRTVGLSNGTAQYWATPDATTGAYTIANVVPGTYVQTLYQGELAVGTETVAVTAGATAAADIVSTLYQPAPTWRIGTWDGTPGGFLNAGLINTMHPSDVRMSPWTAVNYVVGTTPDSAWPLAEFVDVNNTDRITFTLTAAQAAQAQTLRIGISVAFAGGRPRVTVNAGQTYAWTSAIPSPSSQPDSRGITRGTWRGNNTTFAYAIPTLALKAGTNTIDLPVVSGSSGTTFLSPSVTFDAIDLVPTATLAAAPVVTAIAVTPANPSVVVGGTRAFVAAAYDQFGHVTPANFSWSAIAGTIGGTGVYTAPAAGTTDTVAATAGTVAGSSAVTVIPTTFGSAYGDGFYVRLATDGVTEQIWIGTPGAVGPAFAATPTYAALLSQFPSLAFGPGSAANGALTVDGANGNPIPAAGITYDGGGGTDAFALVGTPAADAAYVTATQVQLGGLNVALANVETDRVTLGSGGDILTQQAQPAAALTWTDPTASDALYVTGGTFTFPAPGAGTGVVPVSLKSMTIGAGARVALATAAARSDRTVLVVSSTPAIAGSAGAWTGTLDLGGNDLRVKAALAATVLDQVTSGLNLSGAGYWNGTGITSSSAAADPARLAALGAVPNDGTIATFDGQATAAGDVVVRSTVYGDANLDGVVTAADYTRLDAGFVQRRTGWANGDFNYDGVVDGSDYTLADNAFNRQPIAVPALVVAAPKPATPAAATARSAFGTASEDERRRHHVSRWGALAPAQGRQGR